VSSRIHAQRFIGQRLPRKEDARLLTGRGTYVDDVSVKRMLHAAFVRSPIARGRILSIDSSAALQLEGVHSVLTHADIARFDVKMHSFYMLPVERDVPALPKERVDYAGHPVAIVLADTRALAEDAAGLVVVDYAEEDPVVTIDDARNGPLTHLDTQSNVAAMMGEDEIDPDLDKLLKSAPHLVERTVVHQRISQSPMEGRGVVAVPEGAEELTLHITCQSPHLVARHVTLSLGLPNMSVRVLAKDVGGSFGFKNHPWLEEMAAIMAALITGRPVKWIEDRLENLTASNQAREQEMTLRLAFDKDGRLLGGWGDYDSNNGALPQGADPNLAVHMFMWTAYKIPAYGFATRAWYTNTAGLGAYRGPWAMESLVREVTLDAAARQIGLDPVEIRRRNLIQREDLPLTNALGLPIDDVSTAECLEALVEKIDLPAFRAKQAEARKQGRYLGVGFSAYVEPTGTAGSMAVMTGELAQIRIEPTGKVTASLSTHSQGHGTQTTMAQIIAEQVGVPYEDVTVFEGDSAHGGFSPGAAGSRQAVVSGGAASQAARILNAKVRKVAGHLLNANPEDVRIENGMVSVMGAPEMTRSLREISEIAYGEPARLPPGHETGLEAQIRYSPPAAMTLTSAAHACFVEVDPDTGFVKITRWVASEDVGVMINPAVVEGQIAGGLAQAIGMVLLEEAGYDERGNPVAATFKDYLLPTIFDVPDFEYVHCDRPANNEGGFRGVGEGGAIVGPPAVVNAIADALAPFGEVPLDLPLTPSKLLAVIEGRPQPPRPRSRFTGGAGVGPAAAPSPDLRDMPAAAAVLPGGAQAAVAEAAAEARIDGAWKMTLATPMGPQEMTGHFQTDGGKLTGRLDSDQGSQDFEGAVEGARLKWEMKVTQPMPITLKYDVLIEGDQLTGKVKMGAFGNAKLTGTRAQA
jgi:carbon-monoxide dehydrogenase large subunit